MLLRKPSLVEDYDHIYSGDPALDSAHPDHSHDLYVRTGDAGKLRLKDGLEPLRFRCRAIRGKSKIALSDFASEHGTSRLLYEACALGLVQVAGAKMDDGTAFELGWERDRQERVTRVSESSMEVLFGVDDGKLVYELGARILKETFGDPT